MRNRTCYRDCYIWSDTCSRSRVIILLMLVCITRVSAQCKDDPLCSFMAAEGECESIPEDMLLICPKACKNPCLCPGISSDTACDCLIKAKEGFCDDPDAMVECQSTCTLVEHESCPLLDLPVDPNARLSTWSTKYLTTVTEVCDLGYMPVDANNQGKKTCTSGQMWTEDPFNGAPVECELIDCGTPPSPPHTLNIALDTLYGSKADYTCAKGYVPFQGQNTLTCNASGVWEGEVLTCKKLDCGQPPSSPNSSFEVTSTSQGGIASYTCSVGFKLVQGSPSLSCNASGIWQGSLIVCQGINCGPPPSVAHATISVIDTFYGDTANYTCSPGYKHVQGNSTLTCGTNKTWEGNSISCQRINCGPPPSVAHATISVIDTFYGDTANYTCSPGYKHVQGNSTLTCGTNETWEGNSISCQRINCGPPPSVAHATISVIDTFYGDTANYTCSPGYKHVQGNSTLTCGTNKTWEGNSISCQRINCGPPPSVAHATISVIDTFYGDTANYTCSPGYKHVQGNSTLTCGTNETWEGNSISCQRINCGPPPSVAHATISVIDTFYGDTANYTCSPGYKHVQGNSTLTCGTNETWEGNSISCQRINCGPPPSVAHATISVIDTFYGDTANYTCSPGYKHVQGNSTLTCGTNKTWEGNSISCQRINCGPPPSVAHATISVIDTFYGDTANYTCSPGYKHVQGNSTLTCGTNKTWEGNSISCQRINCGPPPSVAHATISVIDTFYGDTANYTCSPGYKHVQGNSTLTCGTNKTWEGNSISCQRINCGPPPSVAHATISVIDTFYGDTANYTCSPGYKHVQGNSTLTCGTNETWEGNSISCQRINCGPPPSVAHATISVIDTFYGDTANYTCSPGYKHVQGNSTLTCGTNKTWEGNSISCQRINCGPPPSVAHATISVIDTFYGDTANYTCSPGYKHVQGNSTLTCGTNETWEGNSISCQRIKCGPPPSVAHATISVIDTFYGDTANYTCSPGYKHVQGNSTLTCGTNETWEGNSISCQRINCGPPPSVAHATISVIDTFYGDTANYTCSPGYKHVQGNSTLTCGTNETWEGNSISCQRIKCGPPPSVAHATISVIDTFYGDTANYTCSPGYKHVQGNSTLTCGTNETWEGNSISCQRINCGPPPSVAHATISVIDTFYGDTANYTCSPGYKHVQGNSTLTCGTNETWEGNSISCQRINCGPPPSVAHATISVIDTFYGDTANYTCSPGYKHVQGNSTLTCGTNKTWEGNSISCQRINCGPPPSVAHATISVIDTFYGDTANYTCSPGYKHVQGNSTLTCGTNETWEGNSISCQRINCGPPPSVAHATISVIDTFYGDTANYTCSPGYKHVQGNSTLTCGTNKTWEGNSISCQRINCGPPPSVAHATISVIDTFYGDTANYTCSPGYKHVQGNSTLTCGTNETWEGNSISCQRIKCGPPPSVAHATISVIDTFYGDTANYTCSPGYKHVQGNSTLTCGTNETWEGNSISCQRINCGPPPSVAHATISVIDTFYGDTANYTCSPGYKHVQGNSTLTCGTNETWEGNSISCQRIKCGPPPSVAHATISVIDTFYGDTANYTCSPGYKHVQGNSTLTCGTNETWEGNSISCQRINCGPPPSVAHATISVIDTFYGDTANYTCSPGYKHVQGNSTLTCGTNETWEGNSISCQRINCGPPPSVAHGTISVIDTFYGDTANYTCSPGYKHVQGNSTLTCGTNKTWEGNSISCQRIHCGPPPSVPHATISVIDTFYGDTANYTCSPGYKHVQGNSTLTCGATGIWKGIAFSCQKINCGQPPPVRNAVTKVSSTLYGDTANYTCQPGYKHLQGNSTLTCGTTGNWEGTSISCLEIDCGQPPFVINAQMTVSDTKYGDIATYVCEPGYKQAQGDMNLTCRTSGRWEGVPITCKTNSPDKTPTFSHSTLEAPAAWAIGVAIFAILATLIVLFVVLDFCCLRKHSKYMRKNVRNFRKDMAHSMSRFQVWVKWKPNEMRAGRFGQAHPTTLPNLSPSPSLRSIHKTDFRSDSSDIEPSETKSTYLTVSKFDSKLSPPASTLLTSSSSLSVPKSPSTITLSSFSESTGRNTMPNVGF